MRSDNTWHRPIIILGAPRSGTSLLHRLIRGCDGFASVAKESGFIWSRYTHPSLHEWRSESWDREKFGENDARRIRALFARYALPSSIWRRVDEYNVLRYQRYPAISALLRPAYHLIASVRAMSIRLPEGTRLVDKSVHSGLWVDLVDRVFPDAIYLHIVRNPYATVESMASAWRNPKRFFTYRLPREMDIPGYTHKEWNFALPPDWERYTSSKIESIAAFQWAALQESILDFSDHLGESRYLRIYLEDLNEKPSAILQEVCRVGEIPFDARLSGLAEQMPVVNARGHDRESHEAGSSLDDAIEKISPTVTRLGYSI